MRSEAQRSWVGLTEFLGGCDFGLGMISGGLEGHAFLRMEFHIEGVPDGRAHRGMAAREQDAAAELDLEIDEFAEKYFLVDPGLPDVVSRRARFGELHVLGT